MKKEIHKMESECTVEMEKRFGKGVSLADIEAFAVNRTLEEMKESARRKQETRYQHLEKKHVRTLVQYTVQYTYNIEGVFNSNMVRTRNDLLF